jgi:hypothetical protein
MFIVNAFSLNMVDAKIRKGSFQVYVERFNCTEPKSLKETFPTLVSAIGHADTAHVLGFEPNRVTVQIGRQETIIVAQLVGGRLPEGCTELPDGFEFEYFFVTIV